MLVIDSHVLSLCERSFIFLYLENYGVRKLEALFAVLIATMAVSFAWMFGETKPDGRDLLLGEKIWREWIQFVSLNYGIIISIM